MKKSGLPAQRDITIGNGVDGTCADLTICQSGAVWLSSNRFCAGTRCYEYRVNLVALNTTSDLYLSAQTAAPAATNGITATLLTAVNFQQRQFPTAYLQRLPKRWSSTESATGNLKSLFKLPAHQPWRRGDASEGEDTSHFCWSQYRRFVDLGTPHIMSGDGSCWLGTLASRPQIRTRFKIGFKTGPKNQI